MDPATIALLTSLVSAGGAAASGYLASKGQNKSQTKIEKTKQQLVDQLLGSLNGEGPYSKLFNADQETFQKSFVDPAKSLFNNQIAPQIQQNYISSGQQRGSGMQDQLLRAGVDLDQLLNSQYAQFQQNAENRKTGAINSILGQSNGSPNPTSTGQDVMSALGGFGASKGFSDLVSQGFNAFGAPAAQAQFQSNTTAPQGSPPRRGFERDFMDYTLGDQRWNQPRGY